MNDPDIRNSIGNSYVATRIAAKDCLFECDRLSSRISVSEVKRGPIFFRLFGVPGGEPLTFEGAQLFLHCDEVGNLAQHGTSSTFLLSLPISRRSVNLSFPSLDFSQPNIKL